MFANKVQTNMKGFIENISGVLESNISVKISK